MSIPNIVAKEVQTERFERKGVFSWAELLTADVEATKGFYR
jgi:predicted enzyme related to lactoylglutathione lyase